VMGESGPSVTQSRLQDCIWVELKTGHCQIQKGATRACLIENFLVSDPHLKQVVSHTYEVGLRGRLG
jgi:hypothetical protein